MSDHYYSQTPSVEKDRRLIEDTLRSRKFSFWTDAGVFSKKGVDYGSKHLIASMDLPIDAKVLDIGCGYGPIGLTAAALCVQGHVTLVDINERAVELARLNAERNGISNVTIVQSDLLEGITAIDFDAVLTNPPIRAGKQTVHTIFEQAHAVLKTGGSLWVVIQKKQGAPSAEAKLNSLFTKVVEGKKDKGYWILRAIK
jgi:16S rRNA (guanine1207-N2)-methyltransferase